MFTGTLGAGEKIQVSAERGTTWCYDGRSGHLDGERA